LTSPEGRGVPCPKKRRTYSTCCCWASDMERRRKTAPANILSNSILRTKREEGNGSTERSETRVHGCTKKTTRKQRTRTEKNFPKSSSSSKGFIIFS
jgi:hypothetical protein